MARTPIAGSEGPVRVLSHKVEVAWDGLNYVDESAYVVTVTGVSELTDPGSGLASVGRTVADSCAITLDNSTGRFSPNNATAALYPLISRAAAPQNAGGYFRPVRVELGFLSGRLRVFTGVIVNPDERWAERQVVLTCRDRWLPLVRKRVSTALQQDKRPDELIAAWLTASGLGYGSSLEISERVIAYGWLDDESVGEDINRLLEADGGLCYFDRDGTLIYKSGSWAARPAASVYTFTVSRVEALEPDWSFDERLDRVAVTIRPRYAARYATLWEGPADLSVGPGETITLTAHFRDPVLAVANPAYSTTEADSDWVARNAANALLETAGASSVAVTVSGTYAQSRTVTITNNAAERAYLPQLRLRGQALPADAEQRVYAGSGDQVATLDNPYVQTIDHGQALADARLARQQVVRQTVALRGVPAQPHLEVADRVTVTEADTGIDREFFIGRIAYSFGARYVFDTIDLIDAADWATYAGNYFIIGTSAYGGSGVTGAARLWW